MGLEIERLAEMGVSQLRVCSYCEALFDHCPRCLSRVNRIVFLLFLRLSSWVAENRSVLRILTLEFLQSLSLAEYILIL